tara:strand:- start:252 stop:431 length:180 start_codon:yes stop_codon:yes gene_type:complete
MQCLTDTSLRIRRSVSTSTRKHSLKGERASGLIAITHIDQDLWNTKSGSEVTTGNTLLI